MLTFAGKNLTLAVQVTIKMSLKEPVLVHKRWFHWSHLLFLPYLGFPPLLLVLAWLTFETQRSTALQLLGFFALSLPFLYWLLAAYFNRTQLFVSNGSMEVQHGPFPWPGMKRKLSTEDSFVLDTAGSGKGGVYYGVFLKSDSEKTLLVRDGSKEQAEAWLETLENARSL